MDRTLLLGACLMSARALGLMLLTMAGCQTAPARVDLATAPPRLAPPVCGELAGIPNRPLLAVTRRELLAYLDSLGQPFRTDSSNADLAFTRNRIRAELLPLLRTFNPGIVDVLTRLATQAEEVAEWMDGETRRLLAEVEMPRAGEFVILDAARLEAVGEPRTRALLRAVWDRERWPANGMTFTHWRRAAEIALGSHPAADFPEGVHVRRAGKVVQIRRRSYDNA